MIFALIGTLFCVNHEVTFCLTDVNEFFITLILCIIVIHDEVKTAFELQSCSLLQYIVLNHFSCQDIIAIYHL